jgi:hypothetical protein
VADLHSVAASPGIFESARKFRLARGIGSFAASIKSTGIQWTAANQTRHPKNRANPAGEGCHWDRPEHHRIIDTRHAGPYPVPGRLAFTSSGHTTRQHKTVATRASASYPTSAEWACLSWRPLCARMWSIPIPVFVRTVCDSNTFPTANIGVVASNRS